MGRRRPESELRVTEFATAAEAIMQVGTRLDHRGLAPATAGNYSVRLADGTVAITVSGAHKGRLTAEQIMRVDLDGEALDAKKPSAETLLHCLIYAIDPLAGAVLHTHSIAGTALSRVLAGRDTILFEGYEVAKIFPGIATHDVSILMPLVDNSQDMPALAARLKAILTAQSPLLPAFYIRGHGLYAWGPTLEAAEHIVEASEFLIACAWEELKVKGVPR
jgi:methylthioribulose-1-phosphate dehydratase